ncbi:disintegrin and metalloproteinase domain-containing protein 10 isoform X1 [Polistes fuscatus]|uniref:disintegrin and metalloproteinase domain-containing protein 10 isoform X1 n=1 Tax=Polistes fuscatus TaxID=30207 RepID=UPI001CAA0F3D|nr:disintegrin and metalloproteinase domain-containing protein 10 isoform X1 [Polistes fuscatus]XP_043486456.1 disintegrin and metalloproteinase domain-containing protein 10 isoform X1 [Polistes fuscatus]XP_043486457.1 disintegrin and metalloproteinase domain-containing protein 10 isoform X1 [Polistes fuscatus]
MISDTSGYIFLLLLLLVPHIESAQRLNKYIRHYETLSYPTEEVHRGHLRAKRSVTRDNFVTLKFRSHGRDFHIRLKRDLNTFSNNLVIEGPSGRQEELDTSHIYEGHLIGESGSYVFGSITDGVFHGKIVSSRSDAWYVERAHYYFPPHEINETLHSVIYHENDVGDPYSEVRQGDSGGCGINNQVIEWMEKIQNSGEFDVPIPIKLKKNVKPKVESWNGNQETPGHKYTREANEPNHRRTRRATRPKEDNKNTCSLFIQTDPLIWRHISEQLHHDAEKTKEEILSLIAHHVTAVNYIYRDTRFDGRIEHRNIKFEVQRIKIDDDTACTQQQTFGEPNHFCMENIDVSNFLNLHSLGNHEDFCLAYVFTYRDFTGGTLGLAWVASASGASGGICEKYKTYTETVGGLYQSTKRSLNTGIITFVNYNSRVPPKVSQLTLAHEIGHNFGSPHDFPPECRPGGLHGNYIMFASATSGDRPNNSKFSRCSIGNISNVLDAIEDNKKRNCFTASAGAFCGNKIVEAGEECDCGYDDDECVDKCCYPRQVSELAKIKNETAKGCSRKYGTQCSPSQGPCCSSDTCQFVPYSHNVQCKAESDCSYNSTCNGKSSECPAPLPRANKTRCNEGTQLCINGECTGSICLEWNMTECFLTSNIIPNIDKRKLCELACQNGTDPSTCRSTSEFARVVGLPDGGISLRPGSPCDNFQGYCDVFLKCRAVDAEGPLARLKNLLFNKETLSTVAQWVTEYWWAVLLMGIAFIIFMGLFIKCCAVHTPSSNPKKPPARRISDTLRRPMNTLRRMRHPHGGGGPGPRSIPPRQGQGVYSGTRGPSHGYGEGRGAQHYPKGYRLVPTASAPPSSSVTGNYGRSNHPELYAGAYSNTGGGVAPGRAQAYEMRHHNKV